MISTGLLKLGYTFSVDKFSLIDIEFVYSFGVANCEYGSSMISSSKAWSFLLRSTKPFNEIYLLLKSISRVRFWATFVFKDFSLAIVFLSLPPIALEARTSRFQTLEMKFFYVASSTSGLSVNHVSNEQSSVIKLSQLSRNYSFPTYPARYSSGISFNIVWLKGFA